MIAMAFLLGHLAINYDVILRPNNITTRHLFYMSFLEKS